MFIQTPPPVPHVYQYAEVRTSSSSSASASVRTQMSGGGSSSVYIDTEVDGKKFRLATTTRRVAEVRVFTQVLASSTSGATSITVSNSKPLEQGLGSRITARLFNLLHSVLWWWGR